MTDVLRIQVLGDPDLTTDVLPHVPDGSGIAFSVLDPVVASEILRDLTEVMEQ